MQHISGTRFGTLDFESGDLVTLPEGMIGFPTLTSFIVVHHKEGSPFRWLQSVQEPGIAFLTLDPSSVIHDYEPEINDDDAHRLALTQDTSPVVLVTATIPDGDASQMTVNLAAPIVVNTETRTGKQVVLEGDAYTIKHRPFKVGQPAALKQAA